MGLQKTPFLVMLSTAEVPQHFFCHEDAEERKKVAHSAGAIWLFVQLFRFTLFVGAFPMPVDLVLPSEIMETLRKVRTDVNILAAGSWLTLSLLIHFLGLIPESWCNLRLLLIPFPPWIYALIIGALITHLLIILIAHSTEFMAKRWVDSKDKPFE